MADEEKIKGRRGRPCPPGGKKARRSTAIFLSEEELEQAQYLADLDNRPFGNYLSALVQKDIYANAEKLKNFKRAEKPEV